MWKQRKRAMGYRAEEKKKKMMLLNETALSTLISDHVITIATNNKTDMSGNETSENSRAEFSS